jgi:hypothetical protein
MDGLPPVPLGGRTAAIPMETISQYRIHDPVKARV